MSKQSDVVIDTESKSSAPSLRLLDTNDILTTSKSSIIFRNSDPSTPVFSKVNKQPSPQNVETVFFKVSDVAIKFISSEIYISFPVQILSTVNWVESDNMKIRQNAIKQRKMQRFNRRREGVREKFVIPDGEDPLDNEIEALKDHRTKNMTKSNSCGSVGGSYLNFQQDGKKGLRPPSRMGGSRPDFSSSQQQHLQIFQANPHAQSAADISNPQTQDGMRMNNSQEYIESAKVDVLSSSGGTGGDSNRIINEVPIEHESDNDQQLAVEKKKCKSRSNKSQMSCVSLSVSDEDIAMLLTIKSERCDHDKTKHKQNILKIPIEAFQENRSSIVETDSIIGTSRKTQSLAGSKASSLQDMLQNLQNSKRQKEVKQLIEVQNVIASRVYLKKMSKTKAHFADTLKPKEANSKVKPQELFKSRKAQLEPKRQHTETSQVPNSRTQMIDQTSTQTQPVVRKTEPEEEFTLWTKPRTRTAETTTTFSEAVMSVLPNIKVENCDVLATPKNADIAINENQSNQEKKPPLKSWFRLNTMQTPASKTLDKFISRPPIVPKTTAVQQNPEVGAPQILGISTIKPQNFTVQDATMRSSTGGSVPFVNTIGQRRIHPRLHSAKSDQLLLSRKLQKMPIRGSAAYSTLTKTSPAKTKSLKSSVEPYQLSCSDTSEGTKFNYNSAKLINRKVVNTRNLKDQAMLSHQRLSSDSHNNLIEKDPMNLYDSRSQPNLGMYDIRQQKQIWQVPSSSKTPHGRYQSPYSKPLQQGPQNKFKIKKISVPKKKQAKKDTVQNLPNEWQNQKLLWNQESPGKLQFHPQQVPNFASFGPDQISPPLNERRQLYLPMKDSATSSLAFQSTPTPLRLGHNSKFDNHKEIQIQNQRAISPTKKIHDLNKLNEVDESSSADLQNTGNFNHILMSGQSHLAQERSPAVGQQQQSGPG